jgi:general secretion pathway protein E
MTGMGNGIVLVTGPTGSGKTTTLYSTLRQLATTGGECVHDRGPDRDGGGAFNQMQVNHAIDLDFSTGVRTLMRQDPDIIMVGEIRDLETANMAIQAALTGHLVLSTLHTNDSPSSRVAAAGTRRAGLSGQGHAPRHHVPAPGAHPLSPLQAPEATDPAGLA